MGDTESDNDDLAQKTIEYIKKEGSAEASQLYQEKLRVRLKEAIGNLENWGKRLLSGNLSDEDKKMYEFKIKVENEEIAWLKKAVKTNMSPEEWGNLKKLFPFAKQR